MNKEVLTNFINENKESDDFTGGVDERQINVVQNELGVELPESYKWFLTTYGSGGSFGVDILEWLSQIELLLLLTRRVIEI